MPARWPINRHLLVEREGEMRVVVLSDTHAPPILEGCPRSVAGELEQAELILHAGDVCTPAVLEELSQFAPVRVVRGNNDGPDIASWGAPETLEFAVEGLSVAMIHDSGARAGRLNRLRRRFPAAGLVIFGHSHIPWDETGPGVRILNPGSPTDKRRQLHGTLATLEISDGMLGSARLVEVS